MMSIEFVITPHVAMNATHTHSTEEYCAILDKLVGSMNSIQIKYWIDNGAFAWAIKDALK